MTAAVARTLEELRARLAEGRGKACLIAGGTDLVLHLHEHPDEEPDLIDISSLEAMRILEKHPGETLVGAAVTFAEIEASPLLQEKAQALVMAAASMGSTQIRNRATLGGNVANASAAADGTAALCALDAQALVEDCQGRQERLPVGALVTAPGKTVLGPDRFLLAFAIPDGTGPSAFFKVGSRRAVAISKLSLALGRHLVLGSLAPSPVRAEKAQALLAGPSREAFLDALTETVERAIPARASLAYKRVAVRGLGDDLWRHLKEVRS